MGETLAAIGVRVITSTQSRSLRGCGASVLATTQTPREVRAKKWFSGTFLKSALFCTKSHLCPISHLFTYCDILLVLRVGL